METETNDNPFGSFIIALFLFFIIIIIFNWSRIVQYLARNAFEDEKVAKIKKQMQDLDAPQNKEIKRNDSDSNSNSESDSLILYYTDIPSQFFQNIKNQTVNVIKSTLGF